MPESATQSNIAIRSLNPTPWRHTSTKPVADRGVSFQGIVYGGTGYAEEAWVVAVALAEAGVPVQLAPIGAQSDFKRLLPAYARQSLEHLSRQTVDMQRSIFYQHAMTHLWNMGIYGSLRVGRTMFETDRIPDGWAER